MPDLPHLLRSMVEPASPIPIGEAGARSRRRRRARLVTGAAVAIVAVAAIAVPVSLRSTDRSSTVHASAPPPGSDASSTPASSTARAGGLSVSFTLYSSTVAEGVVLTGEVEVTNATGNPVDLGSACEGHLFTTELVNGVSLSSRSEVATDCLRAHTLPMGTTTEQIVIDPVYDDATGAHPLPTGYYQADLQLVASGTGLPVPPPLAVTISPGGTAEPGPTTTLPATTSTTVPGTPTARAVTVPSIVGVNVGDAVLTLAGDRLGSESTPLRSASVPSGDVIAQSPRAGEAVPQLTRITLYVSSGPEGLTDSTPPGADQPTTTVTIPVSSTAVRPGT